MLTESHKMAVSGDPIYALIDQTIAELDTKFQHSNQRSFRLNKIVKATRNGIRSSQKLT